MKFRNAFQDKNVKDQIKILVLFYPKHFLYNVTK